jgi:hypothetical protein
VEVVPDSSSNNVRTDLVGDSSDVEADISDKQRMFAKDAE